MALWKRDNSVSTGLSAKKGDVSYLQIVKSGEVGITTTARTLGATYIGHEQIVYITHNLPSSFFVNACPEITANVVTKQTDVFTGEDMVSTINPWVGGGLLYTDGTNTAFISFHLELDHTYLKITRHIRRTAGSYTVSGGDWTVQWKIMNPNPSGAIGGMGGGPGEPASSMYVYYDYDFYDDNDTMLYAHATGSTLFSTNAEAYAFV
jgi:hypothetical protein